MNLLFPLNEDVIHCLTETLTDCGGYKRHISEASCRIRTNRLNIAGTSAGHSPLSATEIQLTHYTAVAKYHIYYTTNCITWIL